MYKSNEKIPRLTLSEIEHLRYQGLNPEKIQRDTRPKINQTLKPSNETLFNDKLEFLEDLESGNYETVKQYVFNFKDPEIKKNMLENFLIALREKNMEKEAEEVAGELEKMN